MVGFVKSALNLFGLGKEGGGGDGPGNLSDFLDGLAGKTGYDIQFIQKDANSEGIKIEIEGSEVEGFVGNSSEVLDALSHISMRVQRKVEGFSNEPVAEEGRPQYRITFDAAGFREKKSSELRDLADKLRDKVLETGGKPAYIPAMSPSDRKTIHTRVAEHGDIVSESIGNGNFKRIRIRLKDESKKTYVAPENPNGGQQRRSGGRNNNGGGRRPNNQGRNGRSGEFGRGASGQRNQQSYDLPHLAAGEASDHHIDDNIGNRLAPGEDSPYNYGTSDSGSDKN
jgi:predicted RNA-binding protein Jag